MKYIAYCRKSTDEKDRQVLSIESQIQEIKDFANRQNLEIVEFATEAKTAKQPGREVFAHVLDEIEKGHAQGIVSWHPDRLARNSIDGGKIIYLLDTGKLIDLKFPSFWFENSPQGKFVLNIAFGQSKYYVDNLSENVKRGIRQQLRNGVLPHKPPYGYVYNHHTKRIDIDPVTSKVIKQAFQKYANGENQTYVANLLFSAGFTKKSGKALSLNEIVKFLTNPFYVGRFKFSGEWHEGSHQLFISKSLFNEVQRKLQQNKRNFTNHTFHFLGLIKCGECGASITAEHKTKFYKNTRGKVEYIYYRCTKKLKPCTQKYIQAPALEKQFKDMFSDVALPISWGKQWFAWLERDEVEEKLKMAATITQLEKETQAIEEKLNTLLDGYLDGTLDADIYKKKKNELFEQKLKNQEQITQIHTQGSTWLGPMREFTETAIHAGKIARANTTGEELAFFAKTVGSDFFLENRQLTGEFKNGYAAVKSARAAFRVTRGIGRHSQMERETRFELATFSLATRRSTS